MIILGRKVNVKTLICKIMQNTFSLTYYALRGIYVTHMLNIYLSDSIPIIQLSREKYTRMH